MLSFFRINDPYRLIFIFLILVVLRSIWVVIGLPLSFPELKWLLVGERLGDGFVMYRDLYDHTAPFTAFVYEALNIVFGRNRWIPIAISTLLIIIQAGIFNSTLLKNKAFEENNYLPAFFYVILVAGIPDFFALSPQLMSLTFILLSLNQIFRRLDNEITDELFVKSGFYLAVATLFYLPSVIYFGAFLLSFILFSTAVPRRLLLIIYTSFTVFGSLWMYFHWHNASWDFFNDFIVSGFSKPATDYLNHFQNLKVAAVLLVAMAFGGLALITNRSTNYQQKMQQVMVIMIFGGIIISFLTRELMPADLLFFTPSISFFLVYFFLDLKRKIFRALLPFVMVGCLLGYPYVLYFNGSLDPLIVPQGSNQMPGKSVMGLGVPLELYVNHKLVGPFLDDYISRQKLDDIDYYDEASEIYKSLIKSNPDVIIDEYDMIQKLFHRFPYLADQYVQTDENTYEKKTNN